MGTSPPHLPSDSVLCRDGSGAGKKEAPRGYARRMARQLRRRGTAYDRGISDEQRPELAWNSGSELEGERDEDAVVDDQVDAASERVARGKRLPSETNDSLDFSVARSISCNTCNDDNDNNDCNNDG